jgi:CBS domain-containing protein
VVEGDGFHTEWSGAEKMKARDLMTSNPECVTPEETLQRAAQIMRDQDVGSVPVVDDRTSMRLAGVITDRDIAIRHVAEGHTKDMAVREHMSTNVRTVGPDATSDEVMSTMRDAQVRRVPVVEADNRLIGIIAQADIATEGVGDRKVGETVQQISEGHSRH